MSAYGRVKMQRLYVAGPLLNVRLRRCQLHSYSFQSSDRFSPGDAISTSCHVYFCIIYSVLVFKSAILLSRIRSSSFSRRFSSAKKSDVIEERLAPTEVTDR